MNRIELEEKRQYWLRVLEDWHKSGQSQVGFCREHNFRVWQFRYWHRRLRKKPSDVSRGFVRVHELSGGSGIRLRTAGGLEIELDTSFDEQTLKRFLSLLTTRC